MNSHAAALSRDCFVAKPPRNDKSKHPRLDHRRQLLGDVWLTTYTFRSQLRAVSMLSKVATMGPVSGVYWRVRSVERRL